MKPILLVHGYSAESKADTADAMRGIYGELPKVLRQRFGADVRELDLSRYVSLEDGISVDDISLAMENALAPDGEFGDLRSGGFYAVTHSTGALVVRNWMRRYWDGKSKCPVERIVHLAGAHFGSGWAHIGRSQFAKWFRMVFQGAEAGVKVLGALELGSSWTIEMHMELDRKILAASADDRPLEFCMIGSQRPDEFQLVPVKYATEEATDGVVRVPGGNVNYHHFRFVPKPEAYELDPDDIGRLSDKGFGVTARTIRNPNVPSVFYEVDPDGGFSPRSAPFAVVHDCSHTMKSSSIVDGERPREQVLAMIEAAFRPSSVDYSGVGRFYEEQRLSTIEKARTMRDGRYAGIVPIHRRPQYNRYCQVVFRIFDHLGAPVKSFNLYFNSFGGTQKPDKIINELFTDGHPNGVNNNTITFFIRRFEWERRNGVEDWHDQFDFVNGVDLEIDADEFGNDLVNYVPFRYSLSREQLKEFMKPDRTTIVDVRLLRMPVKKVFKVVSDRS